MSWSILGAALATAAFAQAQAPAASGVATYKQMTLAQLLDVEVTSVSRRAERLSGVASAVQVITGEDIRRAGASTLPAALRLLSNLEVAQVDARQWAITARGFNNTIANKMLVLMDGRTVYTPLFAGVFWDVQDTLLEDIERVEAISGPGATHWGSNAVNGVINITTKPAQETQGGLLKAGGGNELRGMAAARYGGTLAPGVFYRVYTKYLDHDQAVFANRQGAGDGWRKIQGGFRVDWATRAGDDVVLQGDGYDGRLGQATLANIAASGGNVLGRWTRTLAADSSVVVQAYYERTRRRIPGSVTADIDTYDLEFQHRITVAGMHDLVWGAGYRLTDDSIANPATLAFLPPNTRRHQAGGFIEDQITLVPDRVRVTVGTRLEDNPYTGVEYQPSVRAAWTLARSDVAWAAVTRAVRTPSRIDREFYVPATPPFAIAGGPNFRSEKLLAYQIGYRARPREDLAFSVTLYHHDYDGLRSLEPPDSGAGGGASVIGNGLDGRSRGAELAAEYHVLPDWRLRVGYTAMRVRSWPQPGSGDRAAVGTPALDPNRQLLVQSQLDLPANTALDAVLRYVGPIRNHRVAGYTELDVRASWRPVPALEVAVIGRNLLHPRHAEFGAPQTRREIERSFEGTVLWKF
jgi:iron complex outermembrane recepter protein